MSQAYPGPKNRDSAGRELPPSLPPAGAKRARKPLSLLEVTDRKPRSSRLQQGYQAMSFAKALQFAWSPIGYSINYIARSVTLPILRFSSWSITFGTGAIALGAVTLLLVFLVAASEVPEPSALYRYKPVVATHVSDGSGKQRFNLSREYRLFVPYDDIPPMMVNAILAAEDQRFFEHQGLDGVSLSRAMVQNVGRALADRRILGASTITQQVAKMYVGSDRTLERKLREAILSTKMESALSKEQILEIYLNEVYFGVNAYGIGAAAERYFGKAVSDLSVAEMAFLAALPKGPNNYHPVNHRDAARGRRNWVIERLHQAGFLTGLDARYAVSEPLPTSIHYGLRGLPQTYFDLEAKKELETRFGEHAVYGTGLKVTTSLEPGLQKVTELTLRRHLMDYDTKRGYRGPLAQIDLEKPNWDRKFLDLEAVNVFSSWRQAMVVNVTKRRALFIDKAGRRGRIELASLGWARPYRYGLASGPVPNSVHQVLEAGDVILVEPQDQMEKPQFHNETQLGGDFLTVALETATADDGNYLESFELRQLPLVSGAAVVLEANTGQVRAMVGGFSPQMSSYNRVTQAERQPGSTIKPFVVLSALENGFSQQTSISDGPLSIEVAGRDGVWEPKNFDGQNWGNISLEKALVYSRNTPMVRLHKRLGSAKLSETLTNLGLYKQTRSNPSIVLGANETSLLRLASAYGSIANGGVYIKPTTLDSVRDQDGLLLFTSNLTNAMECSNSVFCNLNAGKQVVSKRSTKQLKSMLKKVMRYGTGALVQQQIDTPLQGKTGTTNGSKDTWFMAFDDQYVYGVFIGYDEPQTLGEHATGGRLAGPALASLVNSAKSYIDGKVDLGDFAQAYDVSKSFELAKAEGSSSIMGRGQAAFISADTVVKRGQATTPKPQSVASSPLVVADNRDQVRVVGQAVENKPQVGSLVGSTEPPTPKAQANLPLALVPQGSAALNQPTTGQLSYEEHLQRQSNQFIRPAQQPRVLRPYPAPQPSDTPASTQNQAEPLIAQPGTRNGAVIMPAPSYPADQQQNWTPLY